MYIHTYTPRTSSTDVSNARARTRAQPLLRQKGQQEGSEYRPSLLFSPLLSLLLSLQSRSYHLL